MSDETQDPNHDRNPAIIAYPFRPIHKERMLALADYVETINPAVFGMALYRRSGAEDFDHCGTFACMLGHAPTILTRKFRVSKRSLIDMDEVPREYKHPTTGELDVTREQLNRIPIDFLKVFKALTGYKRGPGSDALWTYLFSGSWRATDDTPTGAAKRIRWVVEHEGIPYHYNGEVNGDKLLSYSDAPDPLFRPTREYLDSLIARDKIKCVSCNNDAEFESHFSDTRYNVICGVCGWKMRVTEGL